MSGVGHRCRWVPSRRSGRSAPDGPRRTALRGGGEAVEPGAQHDRIHVAASWGGARAPRPALRLAVREVGVYGELSSKGRRGGSTTAVRRDVAAPARWRRRSRPDRCRPRCVENSGSSGRGTTPRRGRRSTTRRRRRGDVDRGSLTRDRPHLRRGPTTSTIAARLPRHEQRNRSPCGTRALTWFCPSQPAAPVTTAGAPWGPTRSAGSTGWTDLTVGMRASRSRPAGPAGGPGPGSPPTPHLGRRHCWRAHGTTRARAQPRGPRRDDAPYTHRGGPPDAEAERRSATPAAVRPGTAGPSPRAPLPRKATAPPRSWRRSP